MNRIIPLKLAANKATSAGHEFLAACRHAYPACNWDSPQPQYAQIAAEYNNTLKRLALYENTVAFYEAKLENTN